MKNNILARILVVIAALLAAHAFTSCTKSSESTKSADSNTQTNNAEFTVTEVGGGLLPAVVVEVQYKKHSYIRGFKDTTFIHAQHCQCLNTTNN